MIFLSNFQGLVFFNDFGLGRIYRMNADGTGIRAYDARTGGSITGMAIDKIEDRLYWCDSDAYSIESVDLMLKDRRKLIQKTTYMYGRFWLINNEGYVVNPFDLSIFGDRVFWTDTYKRAIYSANKYSGGEIDYVTGGLDHPRDIHVYNDQVVNGMCILGLIFKISNLKIEFLMCFVYFLKQSLYNKVDTFCFTQ